MALGYRTRNTPNNPSSPWLGPEGGFKLQAGHTDRKEGNLRGQGPQHPASHTNPWRTNRINGSEDGKRVREQEVDLTSPRQTSTKTDDAPNHETGGEASGRLRQLGPTMLTDQTSQPENDLTLSTEDGKKGALNKREK